MSILGLWILAASLGCCIGYVVVRRPAEYYNYYTQPNYNQWEVSQYPRQDYPPSYYGSNYYYYPLAYGYPEPHKPDLKPRLPFDEGQKLLQLYRLIRVIELFRLPPKPKKLTSLDQLVQKLSDHSLEEQLVELLCDVEGYEEVAELERGPKGEEQDLFVNDIARLLLAIQRALNALDLDEYDRYHNHAYYNKLHGYSRVPRELRKQLRQLRDLANSLTVAQIEQELKKGGKAQAKEALVTDLLENLVGEREGKSLVDEFNDNYDVVVEGEDDEEPLDLDNVDKYVVVIDHDQEEPKSRSLHQFDHEELEELATALELYLEQHKAKQNPVVKEKSTEGAGPKSHVIESTPVMTTSTTTTSPVSPATKEDAKESWLGSILGKGNLLPGFKTVDLVAPTKPEAKDNKLDEQHVWVQEDIVDKNSLDFEIDPRLHAATSTEKSNSVSTEQNSELQNVESKESKTESLSRTEQKSLEAAALPESRQEPEDVAEDATEGADELARELPNDDKEGFILGEGPARFDLLADLTEHKMKESTPEPTAVDDLSNDQQQS